MILTEYSIYTIVHIDKLNQAYADGGSGSFVENNAWSTGNRLFAQATKAGQRMPVIFADAAATTNLVKYGFLTEVEILDDNRTHYAFENLTAITMEFPKSVLIKRSDGKPLSDDYIRPYSIVYTPSFITLPAENKPAETLIARLVDAVLPDRFKTKHPTTPIYLFGYSGKTDDQIEKAIGKNGLLIDIRYSPKTRRPDYSRAGLIRTFGERYHHIRELGNANYKVGGIRLADPDAGLKRIDALANEHQGPLFLMCACEDGRTCHRRQVGELLKRRGYLVSEYDFGKLAN